MFAEVDLEALFTAAVLISDDAQRHDFVATACGDNRELRTELQELLSANVKIGSFLESPAATNLFVTSQNKQPGELPGMMVDSYKLLEQIGEGGMGLVFTAEQLQPLRRHVALKIIKPGLDTRAVIARFEAERQALALMDHPNIARVYDAGATDSGRPYFVMELVQGAPITTYCEQHDVSLRGRLALFIEVCDAVQHAHRKGVIHRDLKPTNILVCHNDTKPTPKVIDFGVAKATTQPLTENVISTDFAQIIGTPLYMSPEQASSGVQDIDTRSDVYSLGVVLFELLTGTTPFDAERIRRAGIDEMRRIIREEEPPKPSTRAKVEAMALRTIARKPHPARRVDLSTLEGELDWIVLKSLEKDRQRRYESPGALAADVVRYINHEPIEACPPTFHYRLKTFARRNRVALLAGGAVAATTMVGLVVAVCLAVRAQDAERRAQQSLRTAESHWKVARQAVDDMYTGVAEKWLTDRGELSDIQRDFLEKAQRFYEQSITGINDTPQSRLELASAQFRAGRIQRALGHFAKSQQSLERSVLQLETLFRQDPNNESLATQYFAVINELGHLHHEVGNLESSDQILTKAISTVESIADTSGRTAHKRRLAQLLQTLGATIQARDPRTAEDYLRRGRAISQQLALEGDDQAKFLLARAEASLAEACLQQARFKEALTSVQSAIDGYRTVATSEPANRPLLQGSLSSALQTKAAVLIEMDKAGEACEAARDAVHIRESLAESFPSRNASGALLQARCNLIQVLENRKELDQLSRDGLELAERLHREYPNVPDYCVNLSQCLLVRSYLERSLQPEQARRHLQRALASTEQLVAGYPNDPYYRQAFATTCAFAATNYAATPIEPQLFDPTLALSLAKRAVEIDPQASFGQRTLGQAYCRTGNYTGCIEALTKVDPEELRKGFDGYFLAMAYLREDKPESALQAFHQAESVLPDILTWNGSLSPDTILRIRNEAATLLAMPQITDAPSITDPPERSTQ